VKSLLNRFLGVLDILKLMFLGRLCRPVFLV
jgi:hypothetical protein